MHIKTKQLLTKLNINQHNKDISDSSIEFSLSLKIAQSFAFIASPYGAPCGIECAGNSERVNDFVTQHMWSQRETRT